MREPKRRCRAALQIASRLFECRHRGGRFVPREPKRRCRAALQNRAARGRGNAVTSIEEASPGYWSAVRRLKRASQSFWSAVRSTALVREQTTQTPSPLEHPARCFVREPKRRCRAALQSRAARSSGNAATSAEEYVAASAVVDRRGRRRVFGVRCEAPLWFANRPHKRLPPLSILPAASCANQSGAVAPHSKTLREYSNAGTEALASSRANQSGAVAPRSKGGKRRRVTCRRLCAATLPCRVLRGRTRGSASESRTTARSCP